MFLQKISNKLRRSLPLNAFIHNIKHFNFPVRLVLDGKLRGNGFFLNKTSFHLHGKGNRIEIGQNTRLRNCDITVCGDNCTIKIGERTQLLNCQIIVTSGSVCQVSIESDSTIRHTSLYLEDDNSAIKTGRYFTMESGHIAATEGSPIEIGEDCMFSNDIEIRSGDSHAIVDRESHLRTNEAKAVKIGNHVWLTAHVRILKGSCIPDDCIIGNSAVVSGQIKTPHAIYGGSPLKILKENRTWDRNRHKKTFDRLYPAK